MIHSEETQTVVSDELVKDVLDDVLAAAGGKLPDRHQVREIVARSVVERFPGITRKRREQYVTLLLHELTGLGPLERLLEDAAISEIMVNRHDEIFVERGGMIERTALSFRNQGHLEDTIQRIVAKAGKRIDFSTPFVDTRLPDGSRVHIIIPPLAIDGPYITIRKFRREMLKPEDLLAVGACTEQMMSFLERAIKSRCNVIVSGGTSSGKTTLLNALSTFIDSGERVITIEDSAELQLQQQHVLRLEARPPNIEGKGEVTIRTLVRNALRMRPDRIIIGEVRGAECFDLLHAWNTGHEGSMSTVHANSPPEVLHRLAGMVLMAEEKLPHEVIMEQLGMVLEVVVHMKRFRDGKRRIERISVMDQNVRFKPRDIFVFHANTCSGAGEFKQLSDELPQRLRERISSL